MSFQPAAVVFPDVELWATAYLRAFLAGRLEPYAAQVRVSNEKADETVSPYPRRQVVVRRDGGPQDGLFDIARVTVRVWAEDEQACADLSRLSRAGLMIAPGNGPVVRVSSPTGPQGVPDERGPMKFFVVEVKTRGSNL